VAGVIIGGVLSDALLRRTGSRVIARKGVAIASMTACAACFLLAFRMPDVRSEVAVASLGAFLAGFSSPCSYAATMEVGGRHVGVVFGFMNMAGNLGAMLFPTVVAWLVVETGSWAAAVTFFAALHLAAAACWLGVNPEKTVA
jgi:nitrate/nitrite transporter NarK